MDLRNSPSRPPHPQVHVNIARCKWYPASIVKVYAEGELRADLLYDDGDDETAVPARFIRPIE